MNRLKNILVKNEGSMVVEASLILPMIIICIIAVVYIALLLYEQACMQSRVNAAAERGAAVWSNKAKAVETGKIRIEDLNSDSLYRRIIDYKRQARIGRISDYSDVAAGGLLSAISTETSVECRDFTVYKKLIVSSESVYRLPLENLLRVFGSRGCYTIKAEAEAVIDDPMEFVRNMDFLLDVERELENTYPGMRNMGEKTRGLINGIKEKVYSFIK